MKNFAKVSAVVALMGAASAFAAPTEIQLADGYNEIGDVAVDINLARQYTLQAIADRDGFVKNDFDATLSANVIAAVEDNNGQSRFGVIAASNKGYNVFTGSSVGGSVAQCGDQLENKNTDGLATTLVTDGNLDLDEANGCAR